MAQTIAAISTGQCVSAIGILRLSGDDAVAVAGRVFRRMGGAPLDTAPERKLVLGALTDRLGRQIDQCMAVVAHAPASYTGEDTVEFHCHGSPAVLAAGLEALYQAGARPAQRGEFTKRAFLNGKLDLTQAEAVIDLIEADTADAAANAAGQVEGRLKERLEPVYSSLTDLCSHFHAVLDYPDEEIEDFGLANYRSSLLSARDVLRKILATYAQGRILRQGVSAAIIGRPNVGKSSLLNAMAGYDRAIVTDIPGTTRDTVEESVLLGRTRLRLIDTAGIRRTEDAVEAIGVERSRRAVQEAALALPVIDGSRPLAPEDREILETCRGKENVILLLNKADLGRAIDPASLPLPHAVWVSAKTGEGLDALARQVEAMFRGETPCDGSVLTNPRQHDACHRAEAALSRVLEGLDSRSCLTPDAALLDVEEAMEAIGEVTGASVREDITSRIFERFCVGK